MKVSRREVTGASLTIHIPLDKLDKLTTMSDVEKIPVPEIMVSLLFNSIDIMYEQLNEEGKICKSLISKK